MIKTENLIAVVDVGSSMLTCMLGQSSDSGQIRVLDIALEESIGVERGCIKDIDTVSKTITSLIQTLENRNHKKVDKLYIGYNARSLRVFSNTLTETFDQITLLSTDFLEKLSEKNRSIVLDKEESVISILPSRFVLDSANSFVDVHSRTTKKIEATYLITSGKQKCYNTLDKVVSRAGFQLAGVFVNATCSAQALLSSDEWEKGTVVVDMGAGTTSVAICANGVIRHLAIIPLGGNVLDNDIIQGCNVDRKTAQKLKETYGGAITDLEREDEVEIINKDNSQWYLPVKRVAYIIESRLEEIIENVDYQIELAGFNNRLDGGIVLTGGVAQLKNISQLFSNRLGINCRLGLPTAGVIWPESIKPKFAYSAAVGLLTLGKSDCAKKEPIPVVEADSEVALPDNEGKKRKFMNGLLSFFDNGDEGESM